MPRLKMQEGQVKKKFQENIQQISSIRFSLSSSYSHKYLIFSEFCITFAKMLKSEWFLSNKHFKKIFIFKQDFFRSRTCITNTFKSHARTYFLGNTVKQEAITVLQLQPLFEQQNIKCLFFFSRYLTILIWLCLLVKTAFKIV